MESLASLYKNHIATLQERTRDALARFKLDALLIHSGELFNVFLDDHPYPFKVNPQFKAWVPVTQVPNCWLLVDGVNKPKLWFYLPVDYWHNVEPLPTSFWTEDVEVIALPKADGIGSLLPAARGNIGYIGPVPERALQLGIEASNINPKGVIDYLHYYRSFKTEYELACMREAQKMAVNGHRAAEEGEALAVVIIAVKLGTLEILLVVHEVPRHALPLVGEKPAVQAAPGKAHIGVALKVQLVAPRVRDALVERQNDAHAVAVRGQQHCGA